MFQGVRLWKAPFSPLLILLTKKFSLRIPSVNVTKSGGILNGKLHVLLGVKF